MVPSGLPSEHPSKETVWPRPPGRVHSSRMLGGAPASSLMNDQAMRTARLVAPPPEDHLLRGGAL
jgi:hypothetical protein